ncbi:MAG: tRNA (adenosine(37)-N6)-threonylcarbamoyltransferase complex dimerization subunit type 1 TsaB [Parashewanella sp.]
MSKINTVLAIDTCTEACSVALYSNNKIYVDESIAPREHSQKLLKIVNELLNQAAIELADIDCLAYGRGPGSFTGIRICTSMAQGLSLGHDLPVIGISTLKAMAIKAQEQGATQILCAIDARMGEVYWCLYLVENGQLLQQGDEMVSKPEDVFVPEDLSGKLTLCGTGFDTYPQLTKITSITEINESAKLPSAQEMLTLALRADTEEFTIADDIAPVYLRNTVAWKKLPGRE